MKIRCIANTGASLPENYLDPAVNRTTETLFRLTVGKEYIVYAIDQAEGKFWYYICDDNFIYYPQKHCAPLFEIVDDRVSKYWRFKLWENGLLEIAFPHWLNDPYFYEKLTDKEPAEVDLFKRIKALMDIEAEKPPEATEIVEKELVTAPI
ncbi:hypothetical protein [Okeania sp.]|uniref:hypothetical protein n=1 Tax=Okeania sp. TaxID=3100323 RepID=UPI002B4B070A|nr:hypothetical protein [Okeania sp.]MEB3340828.1 hypothetical protein [Okeania sp.]